jgi:CRP-like cAMP-binding protein
MEGGSQAHADLLRSVSVFGALRPDVLDFLLGRATRVTVPAGELFMREGEPGGDLYVLESGRAEVFKERSWKSGDPVHIRLAELERGECFGETSILAIMPRCASVRALSDCVALRLLTTDLLDLYHRDVQQFAQIMVNLGREVARRLWVTNELLVAQLFPGA